MKKLLLPLALMAAATPAFAINENTSYEPFEGLECVNLYNISRAYSQQEFLAEPFAELNNKIRSIAQKDGKLYLAYSHTRVEGEESNDYASLLVYDQLTGKFINEIQLTVGGQPLSGLLCANQVGVDDFGNFWLMGLVGNTETTPWKLYHIKDLATGECELIAELSLPAEEVEAKGRHDYYDLVGDVTGKEAGTVVMSPVASGDNTWILGFVRAQGSDQWGPHMNGGDYTASFVEETYPADQTTWNGAPMIRIVRDEDHSGTMFYIDAFVTYPTLYNDAGTMIDSFIPCTDIAPQANSNGCIEFSVAGKDFFAYTLNDYDKGVGTQVRVARFGEGLQFDGMTAAWDLPKNGLGAVSDTGTRMMGIAPRNVVDENGKEGCYLSLFKCNGGLATYLISEPGFKAGVNDIYVDEDNSKAPVEYFNMQGIRLDNPVPGTLVIRRQGTQATKLIVK